MMTSDDDDDHNDDDDHGGGGGDERSVHIQPKQKHKRKESEGLHFLKLLLLI